MNSKEKIHWFDMQMTHLMKMSLFTVIYILQEENLLLEMFIKVNYKD